MAGQPFCYQHPGGQGARRASSSSPSTRVPPRPPATSGPSDQLAEFAAAILTGDTAQEIAERAARYVDRSIWDKVIQRHKGRGCDDLAKMARLILEFKDKMHAAIGAPTAVIAEVAPPSIERTFASELAAHVTLPLDAQLTTAARGLQIIGIVSCLLNGTELKACACFCDVMRIESKERVGELTRRAVEDWEGLSQMG
ncbi:hypothetical protein ACXZ65_36520 [Streptomyces aculeolatus]